MQAVCFWMPHLAHTYTSTRKQMQGKAFSSGTIFEIHYFNAWTDYGSSKLYIGRSNDIVTLICRLVTRDTGLAPVAPLLKNYAKVEKMSVSELNDFVVTAPSQVGYQHYALPYWMCINTGLIILTNHAVHWIICIGKVSGINLDKGWCYVSCSKCSRKLQRSVSTLTCWCCPPVRVTSEKFSHLHWTYWRNLSHHCDLIPLFCALDTVWSCQL